MKFGLLRNTQFRDSASPDIMCPPTQVLPGLEQMECQVLLGSFSHSRDAAFTGNRHGYRQG